MRDSKSNASLSTPLDDFFTPFTATLPELHPRGVPPPQKKQQERRHGGQNRGGEGAADGRYPMRPLDVSQLLLQEQTSAIYSYYGLPLVSVRDGLLSAMRAGDISPMDWTVWADFGFHPPPAMQAFVAGAVLEVVRRVAELTPPSAESDRRGADGAAWQARQMVLPPAMHAGLPERLPLACYVWGIDYKRNPKHFGYRMFAPPPTLKSVGWAKSMEQRTSRAGAQRVNPGLRANESGAELILQLNTRLTLDVLASARERARGGVVGGGARGATSEPVMQLEYLASAGGGMGSLIVSCVSGCTCTETSFDAHAPASRGSRHVLGCVPVTEASACIVRLRVGERSQSGGSKFVLHGLRVLALSSGDSTAGAEGKRASGVCNPALPTDTTLSAELYFH